MTEWRRNESISVPICESPTRQTPTSAQRSPHSSTQRPDQPSVRASEDAQAASAEPEAETGVEHETDEEAATTVLPARGFTPSAAAAQAHDSGDSDDGDDDSDPTDVIETPSSEEAQTRVVKQVETPNQDDSRRDDEDAKTTVLPVRNARQMSRERLQAQAEIERQARERLRKQRERNHQRFNNPEGH